jgi:hypothetical protein
VGFWPRRVVARQNVRIETSLGFEHPGRVEAEHVQFTAAVIRALEG